MTRPAPPTDEPTHPGHRRRASRPDRPSRRRPAPRSGTGRATPSRICPAERGPPPPEAAHEAPNKPQSGHFGRVLYSLHQVTSASVKPRLAGRQPSVRGGVPRVMTRSGTTVPGKRGPLAGSHGPAGGRALSAVADLPLVVPLCASSAQDVPVPVPTVGRCPTPTSTTPRARPVSSRYATRSTRPAVLQQRAPRRGIRLAGDDRPLRARAGHRTCVRRARGGATRSCSPATPPTR